MQEGTSGRAVRPAYITHSDDADPLTKRMVRAWNQDVDGSEGWTFFGDDDEAGKDYLVISKGVTFDVMPRGFTKNNSLDAVKDMRASEDTTVGDITKTFADTKYALVLQSGTVRFPLATRKHRTVVTDKDMFEFTVNNDHTMLLGNRRAKRARIIANLDEPAIISIVRIKKSP